ncbi:MAG: DEAD/DEAH box helicase [Flavobacteriales bacterium]|nr:DEAD/DEAH box helicase [Flavobacteriales bacterium]
MQFDKLKIPSRLQTSLIDMGIEEFSKSQAKIHKRVNSGQNSAVRTQLNLDKKIAYLTSICRQLSHAQGNVPRALLVVPDREVVIELGQMFQEISAHTDIRTMLFAPKMDQIEWIEKVEEGFDFAIATPGKLFALFQSNLFKFNDIKLFVVDDLDYLFDLNLQGELQHLVNELPSKCHSVYFSELYFDKTKEWLENNYYYLDYYHFEETLELNHPIIESQYFYTTPNNQTKVRMLKNQIEQLDPSEKMVVVCRSNSSVLLVNQYLERNTVGAFGFLHPNDKVNKNEHDLEQFEHNLLNLLIVPLSMLSELPMNKIDQLVCFESFLKWSHFTAFNNIQDRHPESKSSYYGTEEENQAWAEMLSQVELSIQQIELPEGVLVDEKKMSIIEDEREAKAQLFSKGNTQQAERGKRLAGVNKGRKVTKFKKKRKK